MRFLRPVTLVTAIALVLATSAPFANAGSQGGILSVAVATADAPGKHRGHDDHGTAPERAEDLARGWAALEEARDAIAADVAAERLETIHEKSEPLPSLAKALLEHASDLEAAKRTRVQGAISQISKVANTLHEAADDGNMARTRRALERLDALLDLIRAQYPEGALSPPPSAAGS